MGADGPCQLYCGVTVGLQGPVLSSCSALQFGMATAVEALVSQTKVLTGKSCSSGQVFASNKTLLLQFSFPFTQQRRVGAPETPNM